MKLTDFKVLTFDVYGTLIDWETGIIEAVRAWGEPHRLEPDESQILNAFSRRESAIQKTHPATLYPEVLRDVFVGLSAELGVSASAIELQIFGNSVMDWPAFPDSPDALAYLSKHYKLGVLSNIDRASFAHSRNRLGVDFDLVVTAEDVGSYKPNHAHFERALRELANKGYERDQILHVAQSLFHDHVPAKALGLRTVWINRRAGREGWGATPPPPSEVTPDWEVPSMAAFVELHKQAAAD